MPHSDLIQAAQQIVQESLSPFFSQSMVPVHIIKKLEVSEQKLLVNIRLGFPLDEKSLETLRVEIVQKLSKLSNMIRIDLNFDWKIMPHVVQAGVSVLPSVKNILAIASAKGGVGKSTTAINLALAMVADGARVGLLDADIYGPNQPMMLGITERPVVVEDKKLQPLLRYGLQTMSIGYLVGDKTPMIWRGPMVSSALQQLTNDTLWDNLDYLLLDMPPGTGDIQLTMAQKIPIAGTIIVTTPQDVALLDARKGIEMFCKVKLPVLGIVENMSYYQCPNCQATHEIFGRAGGERLAQESHVPLLGQLPLTIEIRQTADAGKPLVIDQPDSEIAWRYRHIARRTLAQLSQQKINYGSKIPKVIVEEKK